MWLNLFLLPFVFASFLAKEISSENDVTPTPKDMFWGLSEIKEQYAVPVIPFSFDAMEPQIDAKTMELHYSVIFKRFADNLNKMTKVWRSLGEDKSGLAKKSLLDIMRSRDKIPEDKDIKRLFYHNGGGFINHILYFSTMTTNKKGIERGCSEKMLKLIEHSFHNMTSLKAEMKLMADDQFASGWVHLVRVTGSYGDSEYLTVVPSNDEHTPLDNKNLYPILALDLWEHAYYKKYDTNKDLYIENWWKTIDWFKVERLLNWWRIVYPDGYGKRSEL